MTALALQQLVEVRLHGALGARFGRVHLLAVDTAAEAVQALTVLYQGFAEALRSFHGPGFRVRVGRGAKAAWRDASTLRLRLGSADRVDIVPVIHGRKRNGVGQVIVGVIILVAAYYGYGNEQTVSLGISMILGGAIALLSPMPRGSDSKSKQEVSQVLNGPANVTSAGGPVPVIIGRVLVGSVTISAGLSTDRTVVAIDTPTNPDLPVDEQPYYDNGGSGDEGDGGDGGAVGGGTPI